MQESKWKWIVKKKKKERKKENGYSEMKNAYYYKNYLRYDIYDKLYM